MKKRKRHGGSRSNRGSFSKWEKLEFGYGPNQPYRPRYPQSFPEWVKIGQKVSEIKQKIDWEIIKIEKRYDGWISVTLLYSNFKSPEFIMTTRIKVHKIHLRFTPIYE